MQGLTIGELSKRTGVATSALRFYEDRGLLHAGAAILAIAIAIAIILITWGVSTLIRLALSRSREFLADAGAAELTKNPDAMVRALRKIQNRATFDVPSRMEAFFIENPVSGRLTGLLATHPSMEERIEALQRYAGALDTGPESQPPQ